MPTPQTYATHRRLVPPYHYFVFPVLFLNVVWAVYVAATAPRVGTLLDLLVAAALVVLALYARVFALRVQDRVIRLEMTQRLRQLLPAELQPRIGDFTVRQLVGLRFASDRELPLLAAAVLRDRITDAEAIKKMITEWVADDLRA